MRRSFAVAVLVFLSALPSFSARQQTPTAPTPPPQDPKAVAILHQALAALGAQAVASIQDTVIQATITPPPNTGGTLRHHHRQDQGYAADTHRLIGRHQKFQRYL